MRSDGIGVRPALVSEQIYSFLELCLRKFFVPCRELWPYDGAVIEVA